MMSSPPCVLPDVRPLSIRLSGSDDDDTSSDDSLSMETTLTTAENNNSAEVVSESEEAWGSCTTLYSECGDTRSCSELSTQPSEAELAYAPVWYTQHIQTEATASQSSSNQTQPLTQYDHQRAPPSPATNQDEANNATSSGSVTDGMPDGSGGNAGGYAFPNVQYVQQGYATDSDGNTYAVQFLSVGPRYLDQATPAESTSTTVTNESWVDMCQSPETTSPTQPHHGPPAKGFTGNYEVNYPVFNFNQQVPAGPQRLGNHPQLVCVREPGYLQLKSSQPGPTYPVLYVSCAGLLTLLMREGVALEMTLDQTLRVVSEWPRMAAAISARGSESCVFLHDVKVYQEGTTTEVSVYNDRRALMTTDNVYFSSGSLTYRMAGTDLYLTEKPVFNDLALDLSLNVLYSSKSYGPTLIPMYTDLAKGAKYVYHDNGGVTVHVNGVRVYQNPRGDLEVSVGVKYLKVSPKSGNIFLETNWVEMALEQRSVVKVKRGGHHVFASRFDFQVTANGMEAGMDRTHHVYMRPENVRHIPLNPNRYLGDPTLPRIRKRSKVRTHWRSRPFMIGQQQPQQPPPQDEQTCTCCDGSTKESEPCKPARVQHAEFEDEETRL